MALLFAEVDHFQVCLNPRQWPDIGTKAKRVKINPAAYVASMAADKRCALHIAVAAKHYNTEVKSRLTHIRSEIRLRLVREVLFVPLFVQNRFGRNAGLAANAGYSVEFGGGRFESSTRLGGENPPEIPLADVRGNETTRSFANNVKFDKLKSAFPGLNITLCYRRQVQPPVAGR